MSVFRTGFVGVAVLMSGLASGCAGIDVREATSFEREGVRFYRPHPYLLVTEGEKGHQTQLLYLPDMSKEYVINVRGGLGTVTAGITLTDGWNLTAINETRDSKIPETITAVTGAVTGIAPLFKSDVGQGPGLYRLTFDAKTGMVTGAERVIP